MIQLSLHNIWHDHTPVLIFSIYSKISSVDFNCNIIFVFVAHLAEYTNIANFRCYEIFNIAKPALFIPVYKIGDKKDCNNYLGISLLLTTYANKLFYHDYIQ
jgi:hypothetical protein